MLASPDFKERLSLFKEHKFCFLIGDTEIGSISKADLVKVKRASGRPQNLLDQVILEKV